MLRKYVIGLLLFASCTLALDVRADWYSDEQAIMGTSISVTLWHDNATDAQVAIDAVMNEMRRIDATYSPYIETSELSQMNRKAGAHSQNEPFAISAEMGRLLDKALYYGKLSEGAFDITYATLARYYDYRNKLTPSEAQQKALLPAIDYRYVVLSANKRGVSYAHPALYVDLGGIAKGYAVDQAIKLLRNLGITHASVSAGGDSRVLGDRRGRPWMVGIKNPRGEDGVAITVPVSDSAISTSGDYERFFIDEKGARVHHIINPKTGKSAHDLVSVTVLGPQGFDTDALSTTIFVLGWEKGLALIDRLKGFDCIIITRTGKVHYSAELAPPDV